MQNYKGPNSFVRYTIKYVYLLVLIALTQNIFPQQNNIYSQAPIVFENNIRKSTQLNVKFNVKAFNLSQNRITAEYKEMLPGNGVLKSFFKDLEKKYGEFSFTKIIPGAKWADTLFYDKTTGKTRRLIDMSQLYKIKFNHFVSIDSIITAIEQLKFVSYAEPPIQAVNISDPNDLLGGPTGEQWNLFKIDAPKAWNITKGSYNIKVAEIDGGYPTIGSGQDHATEVSGIIGASTNNNIGIEQV